jgi:ABC-2 type transport system permease protein
MGANGAIKDYPVYLLTGLVLFNYFSEATNLAMGSVVGNFNLITKIYVPKYIFPISKVLSSALNLLFSLIALYLIIIVEMFRTHNVSISWVHLLLPYDLVCIVIFSIGLGLFLSTLTVFFRDMFYIWGVVLTAWNYLTPIMYPETIVTQPAKHHWYTSLMVLIYKVNPLYYFVKYARAVVLDNIVPSLNLHVECLFCAFLMLLIGVLVFRWKQNKFIYYI